MASISNDPTGRRLLFSFSGKRHTIRLGAVTAKLAEAIKLRVERIIEARSANLPLDGETATWLSGIGDELAAKLAGAGLIPAREKAVAATLGAFLSDFIEKRAEEKPNTLKNLRQAGKNLVGHFGADQPLGTITPGMADDWLLYLRSEGFARASIGRAVKYARQFLSAANRAGLVKANPFESLKAPGESNLDRLHFIDHATSMRVLDACPDDRWRLIFALCRWGGLRCPSELALLTGADLDWGRGRFKVHAPKCEHHEGNGERFVPIFPELRPWLPSPVRGEGAGLLLPDLESNQALSKAFKAILRRAGIEPWPKPFQNLRSTRETELSATYPLHVVCAWIGNTARVAVRHYLQLTDDDFARAARIPAQHTAAPERTERQDQRETLGIEGVSCKSVHGEYARQASSESPQVLPMNDLRRKDGKGGAESDATADLARLIAVWPELPDGLRVAIMRMVDNAEVWAA